VITDPADAPFSMIEAPAPTLSATWPPQAWRDPESHFVAVLGSLWHRDLLDLIDGFSHATDSFWRARGVRCAPLSLTAGAISCPIGLGSDAEPVKMNLFGVPTYLSDSQQFPLELACRLSPNGAYCLMHSFRGEPIDERHLAQYLHSEAELPVDLDGLLATIEDYIRHLASFYSEHFTETIAGCAGSVDHVANVADGSTRFLRITFEEAVDELRDVDGAVHHSPDGQWRSLARAGELELMRRFGDFIWVTHHDELGIPFFQASDVGPDGRRVARNADLLMGIGETVGAGERHERADDVREALERHEVAPDHRESYEWYALMREVSPLRTSGFGLGTERFMLWLLQHDDIRDIQLLCRENGRSILP
jgi:asparaginyl-tRNA synthetase